MKPFPNRAMLAFAALLTLAACGKSESPPPAPPAAATPQSAVDCDMSKDMSKMTAEEHQRMMERCK